AFRQVVEAAETLLDPHLRAAYDRELRQAPPRSTERPGPRPRPEPTPPPRPEVHTAVVACPACGKQNRLRVGPDAVNAKCGACGEPFKAHVAERDSFGRIVGDAAGELGKRLFGEDA